MAQTGARQGLDRFVFFGEDRIRIPLRPRRAGDREKTGTAVSGPVRANEHSGPPADAMQLIRWRSHERQLRVGLSRILALSKSGVAGIMRGYP